MPPQPRKIPLINAPLVVTALALIVVLAHVVRVVAPADVQGAAFYSGALSPERFWGWLRGADAAEGWPAYGTALEAALPLMASMFLHGDFSHVILNGVFLVALGKPVHDIFLATSPSRSVAAMALLAVVALTQIAGGLVYLALQGPAGAPAIGSSGAVSGLMGVLLLVVTGEGGRLFARPFLAASAIFLVANVVFAFVAPALIGSSIAWETHVGGYLAGAVLMRCWLAVSDVRRRV